MYQASKQRSVEDCRWRVVNITSTPVTERKARKCRWALCQEEEPGLVKAKSVSALKVSWVECTWAITAAMSPFVTAHSGVKSVKDCPRVLKRKIFYKFHWRFCHPVRSTESPCLVNFLFRPPGILPLSNGTLVFLLENLITFNLYIRLINLGFLCSHHKIQRSTRNILQPDFLPNHNLLQISRYDPSLVLEQGCKDGKGSIRVYWVMPSWCPTGFWGLRPRIARFSLSVLNMILQLCHLSMDNSIPLQ